MFKDRPKHGALCQLYSELYACWTFLFQHLKAKEPYELLPCWRELVFEDLRL